ncbi:MAG: VOC family protein [Alphaproteobacteria bacterium]|nr:VOC family protein [Alphaproteobacteria bacterium]MBV9694191.1 VOC family protein [Alphaproteobacteria bacterium]
MLHHVSVGVRDVARAAKFYDPVLKALGYGRVMDYSPHAIAYGESKDRPEFWIGVPHDKRLPSGGNGTHVAFAANGKAAVNKFHAAALAGGGSNNGEPGPRPDYGPGYYGAFVYDLDGNKIEAVFIAIAKPAPRKKTSARKTPAKKAKKKAKRR